MDDREIGPDIFYASPHLIVVQGDVKTPMDPVFNTPMSGHRVGQNGSFLSSPAAASRRVRGLGQRPRG